MPIYKLDGKREGLQKYRVAVSYTDRNGDHKQVFRVAYGKDEARQLEAELLEEYKKSQPTARLTVRELIETYLVAKKQEVRATSYNKSKEVLERHVLPRIGDQRLDRLNMKVLNAWKLEIGELDLNVSTKRNIFKEFNTALNWAVRFEYMAANPLKQVGTFKEVYFEKPQDTLRYYTSEQFLSFIAHAKEDAERRDDWRYYVFFMIAFYTGMRKGEINALKWSDIDNNVIHVRRSIAQKLKGGDVETPPKNKTSYRDLQIPQPLIDALKDHQARQAKDATFSQEFRVCGGEAVLRDTSIEYRNEQFRRAADLPHIRIHDFRHSHASLLANEGISIQEIARRLGHSNVEITWNTYAHLYPREEERAIAILNRII